MKIINFSLIFSLFCLTLLPGCADKCDDPLSYNYEEEGECAYYYGGKDFGQIDVGSEEDMNNEYDVYIDGDYLGRSLYYFPSGLNCANPQAIGSIYESGTHVVRAVGNGGSEVRQGTVTLDPQECLVVLIENLPLQTGGGNDRYNCVSGSCYTAGSSGTYGSYSDCMSSCGGSGGGYDCVSGSCVSVTSGGTYATYGDCMSSCGGSSNGTITFWTNQDLGCGNIYVTLTSYGTGTIGSYYSGNPGCGASDCANFTGLSDGAYYYSATSDGGCTWNGNIQLSGSCYTAQLTL